MAGGTFTTKNKKRPGAYINFKAVIKSLFGVSDRGIATMPLVLPWGEEDTIIPVTSEDLVSGKSLSKIGLTAADGNIFLNECLKHCFKLLVYKINSGGTKATATSGALTVTAKCFGTLGNSLKVVIKANAGAFDVLTYLNGDLKDKQSKVSTVAELSANDWVNFSGEGALEAAAGIILAGGEDGEVQTTGFSSYFAKVKNETFNVMGIPFTTPDVGEATEIFIRDLRENAGKKVQAVLSGYDSDYEGIIKVKSTQGYKVADKTIDSTGLVAFVTGITAGAEVNESNTYREVTGATEIIGELSEDSDIDEALENGWFILTRRSDGVIVCEQDINSLHTFTPERTSDFSKNRVLRVLDEIGNTCKNVFEKSYIGKVTNNDIGRSLFKSDIIAYFKTLQGISAISDFSAEDIEVIPGDGVDSIVVNLGAKPADSMEKLYMTVTVG
ncbi:MAG: Phage tail sheath protein [Firmicutes bacterium ADurb.Bin193]|nr:MAG: Phage tail sheath protein [Firmicutes bacterium ADurb.Bin193]